MKCIKIFPQAPIGKSKHAYQVKFGSWSKEYDNFRIARSEAENLAKELNSILLELNLLYCDWFRHGRNCWLMDAPFADIMMKQCPTIEYHFMQLTAHHKFVQHHKQIISITEILLEYFTQMEVFYKKRNYHTVAPEIRLLLERTAKIETQAGYYSRNDILLDSKKL